MSVQDCECCGFLSGCLPKDSRLVSEEEADVELEEEEEEVDEDLGPENKKGLTDVIITNGNNIVIHCRRECSHERVDEPHLSRVVPSTMSCSNGKGNLAKHNYLSGNLKEIIVSVLTKLLKSNSTRLFAILQAHRSICLSTMPQ